MTSSRDRLLALLVGAVLVAAGVGAGCGLWMIAEDLRSSAEMLHGLGVVLGGVLLLAAALPAATGAWALHGLRRGMASGPRRALATGIAALVAVWPFAMFAQPVYLVGILPVVLIAAAATAVPPPAGGATRPSGPPVVPGR